MSRLPIPHIINTIKTKLGFDRTMTAPGEDIVDAVNKVSNSVKTNENITSGLVYNPNVSFSSTPVVVINNNVVHFYATLSSTVEIPRFSNIVTGLPAEQTSALGVGKIAPAGTLFLIDVEMNGRIVNQSAIPAGTFSISITYIRR